MLVPSPTSFFVSILVFSAATLAAPTRTHCRCEIVSDTPTDAISTPASAHWTPSSPSPSPVAADICSNLGPELQNFQHSKPDLYASYIRQSAPGSRSDAQRPMSTTVLMNFAVRKDVTAGSESEPRPTSRPRERIVCFSELEPFTAYQSSFVNLWALQIIIAVSILACVAEAVHLGMRLINQRNTARDTPISEHSVLRLLGDERRLLAVPARSANMDFVSSPGAEKKIRAYEATRYLVVQASSGRREFIAYEEEDDDEVNRPVM